MKLVSNFDLRKAAYDFFILLGFFPYFSPIRLSSDSQPYSLVLGILLILFHPEAKYRIKDVLPATVFLFAILISILLGDLTASIRSIVGYLSFFVVSLVAYNYFNRYGFPYKFFRFVIVIWFIFGLIQRFFFRQFGSFIITALRTTEERGVTSLAVEPSYYGIVCIFFLIFVILNKEKRIYFSLCVLQIIFFASSTMAILMLFLLLAVYIYQYKSKLLFIILVSSVLSIILSLQLFLSTILQGRILTLFELFVKDPAALIFLDASINDRVFHVIFSFIGFYSNFGLPNGFSVWESFVYNMISLFQPYAWNVSVGRIMSTYGSALFELGLFGLIFPIFINSGIIGIKNSKDRFFLLIVLNILLLTAIPFAFTLLGLLVGFILYLDRNRIDTKRSRPMNIA